MPLMQQHWQPDLQLTRQQQSRFLLFFFFPFSSFFYVQLLIAGIPRLQVTPTAHCQGSRCAAASAATEVTDMGLRDTQIIPHPQLGSHGHQAQQLMSRLCAVLP